MAIDLWQWHCRNRREKKLLQLVCGNGIAEIKVLKPGPDRTVRPENPQTVHFYGSFSIKNRSMGKKKEPVRTAVGPPGSENRDQTASHGSLLPFESEPL